MRSFWSSQRLIDWLIDWTDLVLTGIIKALLLSISPSIYLLWALYFPMTSNPRPFTLRVILHAILFKVFTWFMFSCTVSLYQKGYFWPYHGNYHLHSYHSLPSSFSLIFFTYYIIILITYIFYISIFIYLKYLSIYISIFYIIILIIPGII